MKNLVLLVLLFFSTQVFAQPTSQRLTEEEKEQIKNLVEYKVDVLWGNIHFIANGKNGNEAREYKIKKSIELFESNNSTIVEKSKSGKDTRYKTVSGYLKTIMARGDKYEVDITRYSNTVISKLTYNSSCACYLGYAIVYQEYKRRKRNEKGERPKGELTKFEYIDKTEKRIEIKVKEGITYVDGQEIKYWDVFLGNITVDKVY